MICRICKDSLDTEDPYTIRGLNPLTFRIAWMHTDCMRDAYDDLEDQPASSTEFLNRQDEYIQKVQD